MAADASGLKKCKMKETLKKIGLFKYYIMLKKLFIADKPVITESLPLEIKTDFYKQFIQKDELYFDVGANVGNRIVIMQTLTNNIVAVEPQPACVQELKKHFGDTIHIEQVGLASSEGTAEMYIADESTISSFSKDFIESVKKTRFKHNNWNEKMNVQMTTMDNLIRKYGEPGFCKIDVEGYELQVLKGLSKPLKCMSFEYCVPEMQISLTNCIDYLNSIGNNLLYNYSVGESMRLHLSEWLNYQQFSALIRTKDFIDSEFGDIYVKR